MPCYGPPVSPTEPTRQITLDQVVAYNLRQARQLRGWTQIQAAEQLEPYLGERWSAAVFSAAERSFESTRVREFTASQVIAFALGFELPTAWFYLPPSMDTPITGRGSQHVISGEDLVRLAALAWPTDAALRSRLDELTPDGRLVAELDSRLTKALDLVFELSVKIASGAPPYDTIAKIINSGILGSERNLALAQIRTAFAQSVPADGRPKVKLIRSDDQVEVDGESFAQPREGDGE